VTTVKLLLERNNDRLLDDLCHYYIQTFILSYMIRFGKIHNFKTLQCVLFCNFFQKNKISQFEKKKHTFKNYLSRCLFCTSFQERNFINYLHVLAMFLNYFVLIYVVLRISLLVSINQII
jgi:hypothetical protein